MLVCLAFSFSGKPLLQILVSCSVTGVLGYASYRDLKAAVIPNGCILALVAIWLMSTALMVVGGSWIEDASPGALAWLAPGQTPPKILAEPSIEHSVPEALAVASGDLAATEAFAEPSPDRAFSAFGAGLVGAFASAGFAFAVAWVYRTFQNRASLGMGDVKLYFATGLYLGFSGALFNLVLSSLIGLAFAVLWQAASRRGTSTPGQAGHNKVAAFRHTAFPFGPSIALSTCLLLLL